MDLLEAIGRPIHVEEVRSSAGAMSLVRSRSGIPWHTDHHRARWILWHCLERADEGGETLLVDGHVALRTLSADHNMALRRVTLFEHSIFRGDALHHPMLTVDETGRPQLYFSLWLADEALAGVEREAFDAFCTSLEVVAPHRLRLSAGDVLVIDNTRMLHARTSIRGERVRHLRRYWLAP